MRNAQCLMRNYLKTIKEYLNTPKGKHDFIDYLKAIILIILTSLILLIIIKLFNSLSITHS